MLIKRVYEVAPLACPKCVSDGHAGPKHLVFQCWDAEGREVKFP